MSISNALCSVAVWTLARFRFACKLASSEHNYHEIEPYDKQTIIKHSTIFNNFTTGDIAQLIKNIDYKCIGDNCVEMIEDWLYSVFNVKLLQHEDDPITNFKVTNQYKMSSIAYNIPSYFPLKQLYGTKWKQTLDENVIKMRCNTSFAITTIIATIIYVYRKATKHLLPQQNKNGSATIIQSIITLCKFIISSVYIFAVQIFDIQQIHQKNGKKPISNLNIHTILSSLTTARFYICEGFSRYCFLTRTDKFKSRASWRRIIISPADELKNVHKRKINVFGQQPLDSKYMKNFFSIRSAQEETIDVIHAPIMVHLLNDDKYVSELYKDFKGIDRQTMDQQFSNKKTSKDEMLILMEKSVTDYMGKKNLIRKEEFVWCKARKIWPNQQEMINRWWTDSNNVNEPKAPVLKYRIDDLNINGIILPQIGTANHSLHDQYDESFVVPIHTTFPYNDNDDDDDDDDNNNNSYNESNNNYIDDYNPTYNHMDIDSDDGNDMDLKMDLPDANANQSWDNSGRISCIQATKMHRYYLHTKQV